MKQLLIIAEIFNGRIRQVTWELASAARKIAADFSQRKTPFSIHIIVPAENPEPLAQKISNQTGMDVIGLQIPELKTYTSEIYLYCLTRLIQKMTPSHILVAHTSQGREFAPGLSLELGAAAISAVNSIGSDKDGLMYSRPVFDNTQNIFLRPIPDTPVVLTLMPGMFKPYTQKKKKPGCIDIQRISFNPAFKNKARIQHRQILKRPGENPALKRAKIIVAAGRGVEAKKNLDLIFNFAKCLSSSAVGASRPLVDMGWIEYEHQVGITGASVTPDVYIACGISGSSQHMAGMAEAKVVISINKNPYAPIFRHSDLCIIEDVLEFIPAFLTLIDTIETA